jgi:hypothetical protein
MIFLLPTVAAIGDLTTFSSSEMKSQELAPPLVEWFHGEGDDEKVKLLEAMSNQGIITLVHWRTGANEEGGGWPDDDANARAQYHGIEDFPAVAVNGIPISMEDFEEIEWTMPTNEVAIDYSIELIGSSEVEMISIIAEFTNPHQLNGATQMHVFIVESEARDAMGREADNILCDWAPSSSFYFSNGTENIWNATITREHLVGAGIDLDDASHANRYELILVMIGGFDNESTNRVISIQRTALPTSWQSSDSSDAIVPAILILVLLIIIGFIVFAERKREKGLPRLEGSWGSEAGEIDYQIKAGYSMEIGAMEMGEGWRCHSRIKKGTLRAGEEKNGTIKVTGKGAFHMRLSVKVDDLGDWILDLDLPERKAND